jgi:thiol-disulfide isomerase/thioredoxin
MKTLNILKTAIYCFILLSFITCAAKTITVTGEVSQYQKLDPTIFIDKSISIVYYDYLGVEERITTNILKDGKFSLSFSTHYPQVIMIQSGSGYYTEVLVTPGENINLTLKYEICKVRTENYPALHYRPDFAKSFIGKNADIQNSFLEFHIKLYSLSDSIYSQINHENIESIDKNALNISEIIQTFFAKNPKYNQVLIPFATQEVLYRHLNKEINKMSDTASQKSMPIPKAEYLSTSVVDVIRRASRIPETTYKKIYEQAFLNNPHLHFTDEQQKLIRKNFNNLLDKTDSINIKLLDNEVKKNLNGMASVDSIVAISECNYFFDSLPHGIAELLTAQKIFELKSDINNKFSYSAFLNKIEDPELLSYVKNRLITKWVDKKNINYVKSTETDIIKSLVKRFPNKHIYVDVWATWCAPCRSEFVYYPNLINKYNDKVVFVFLCESSKEQEYKEIISKLPFKANHYFLNAVQSTNMRNEFNITGIPHYLFITKSGKILNDFKRPSNLDGLQKDIDQEL